MTLKNPIINKTLNRLCQDYTNRIFVPILEADVVGYLYYLWISKIGDASRVHLDTRICATLDRRFDFVTGEVEYHGERPCIAKPELILEAKSFPFGFTDQQHRVHYHHVIDDDIPKLAGETAENRFVLLFDEDDYLKGFDTSSKTSRIERIVQVRNELDLEIWIIHLKKTRKTIEWNLL